MNQLYIAAMFFGVAAPLGLSMVVLFLKGKDVPTWLALTHGGLAATGAVLLIVAFFTDGLPTLAAWALALTATATEWPRRFTPQGVDRPFYVLTSYEHVAATVRVTVAAVGRERGA